MRQTTTKLTTKVTTTLLARVSQLVRAGGKGCAFVAVCLVLSFAAKAQSQQVDLELKQRLKQGLKRSDACSTEEVRVFSDDKARALLKEIHQQQKTLVEKQSKKTQLQAYKDILGETLAYGTVARSLIGPYWRKMSPSEREEYTLLIASILESTVSDAIYNLPVEGYDLLQVSRLGKDFAVRLAVSVENEPETLPIVWRVRCFKSDAGGTTSLGVVDVIFRSVSVIAGKRREMTDIISKQGVGQFLRLLTLERDHLKARGR